MKADFSLLRFVQDQPRAIFDSWRKQKLEKHVLPYSETALERVLLAQTLVSDCVQRLVFLTFNHCEIMLYVQPVAARALNEFARIAQSDRQDLVEQISTFYASVQNAAVEGIDFSHIAWQAGQNPVFPLRLEASPGAPPGEFGLEDIKLALHTGAGSMMSHRGLDLNGCFLYDRRHFASNMLASLDIQRCGRVSVGIVLADERLLPVLEDLLYSIFTAAGALVLRFDLAERPLLDAIALFNSAAQMAGGKAAQIDAFALALAAQSYPAVVLLVENVVRREDIQLIDYLRHFSGIEHMLMCVIGKQRSVAVDFEIHEQPSNLLLSATATAHGYKRAANARERDILDLFLALRAPMAGQDIATVIGADASRDLDALIEKGYLTRAGFDTFMLHPRQTRLKPPLKKSAADMIERVQHLTRHPVATLRRLETTDKGVFVLANIETLTALMGREQLALEMVQTVGIGAPGEHVRAVAEILFYLEDWPALQSLLNHAAIEPTWRALKLAQIARINRNFKILPMVLDQISRIDPAYADEFHYVWFVFAEKTGSENTADSHLKAIGDEYYRHLAHIVLADRKLRQGQFLQSETLLQAAIQFLCAPLHQKDAFEAQCQLALVWFEKGAPERAEESYKTIFIQSQSAGFTRISAYVANDIGNLYNRCDDWLAAERWYKKALELFQVVANTHGIMLVQSNLIETLLVAGKWKEADKRLKTVLAYDEAEGNAHLLAVDWFNAAALNMMRLREQHALAWLDKAQQFFSAHKHIANADECAFLRMRIGLQRADKIVDPELASDTPADGIFAQVMQCVARAACATSFTQLERELQAIASVRLRFDAAVTLYRRAPDPALLTLIRELSLRLGKKEKNYFYYEYYYLRFEAVKNADGLDDEEKEIYFDTLGFFLKNGRTLSPCFLHLKTLIVEKDEQRSIFTHAQLVNVANNWRSADEFFHSLCTGLDAQNNIDAIWLEIDIAGKHAFSFAREERNRETVDELFGLLRQHGRNLYFQTDDIRQTLHGQDRFFFPYRHTHALIWQIDPACIGYIVVAAMGDTLAEYDILERNRLLFRTYAMLFVRFYETSDQLGHALDFIVGESAAMRALKKKIIRVARVDFSVLITGASGSGKELVAKALHQISARAPKPFIAVNAAAIPENLLEAELFGYRKGAFSGAVDSRIGLIEAAHEGILFLDEIADLPLSLQAKLLRVLQEREIRRLGENKAIAVDIRLLSATNRDLLQLVGEHKFRADLYYRLHDLAIHIPPLRERHGDIPLLARFFFARYGYPDLGENQFQISLADWEARDWPGNVRELEAAVKHMITFYPEDEVRQNGTEMDGSLHARRCAFEKHYIHEVLARHGWNRQKTALQLGISRMQLFKLIKKYRLQLEK